MRNALKLFHNFNFDENTNPIILHFIFLTNQTFAKNTIKADSINHLKAVVISYQADKLTPVTFQNMGTKDLKIKSTGNKPSFLLSKTQSITNYSDAGNLQGYSYFRFRGTEQSIINSRKRNRHSIFLTLPNFQIKLLFSSFIFSFFLIITHKQYLSKF